MSSPDQTQKSPALTDQPADEDLDVSAEPCAVIEMQMQMQMPMPMPMSMSMPMSMPMSIPIPIPIDGATAAAADGPRRIDDNETDSPDDHNNRRRHERLTVNLSALTQYGGAAPRHSMLVNVGPGGVFVRTTEPPAMGARIKLSFVVLGRRSCEAVGHVVWRVESGDNTGFGVEFAEANEQMQRFVQSLSKLPVKLRPIYLADVDQPRIETPT